MGYIWCYPTYLAQEKFIADYDLSQYYKSYGIEQHLMELSFGIIDICDYIDIRKDYSSKKSYIENRYEYLNSETCAFLFDLFCGVGQTTLSTQSSYRKNCVGSG
ncbi:MAG TPA: hypothetical protein DIU00_14540 [Phycisphaerales bacterium]|nr:hypothetical protein [Phycisphaerales bacterium]